MSEQRCPDCQRLVPRDCALCDCGHQFRKIAEPPSDSKVLFVICSFVIACYLSGYALSGATSWARLTRDGVGPGFVLLLAFGILLLSSSTKTLRSYLGCGVRVAGCFVFLVGWWSFAGTHNARKELSSKKLVVAHEPNFVPGNDITMFGLTPGLHRDEVHKILSEQARAAASLVFDESDILVSIEGESILQKPYELLKAGDEGRKVSHSFGTLVKNQGDLLTFEGHNRFWAIQVKVSGKTISSVKLVDKAWYLGDRVHYTINGISPRMTRERALKVWGLPDRGALAQYFNKGGQSNRQVFQTDTEVGGVYGWQLEVDGTPVLRVGDSEEQLRSRFPKGLVDGVYKSHHYPISFRLDENGKIAGIASGELLEMVLAPVMPSSLIQKYKLLLTRRVGSKHLNHMLMEKSGGVSPLPKPVGEGTSESWAIPKEVPKELRGRASRVSVEQLLVTDLSLCKVGSLMKQGQDFGPHAEAVSRIQGKWEFEESEKPVGEKSLWVYDSRHQAANGLHFLAGGKLYRVTSNDRDFTYQIAQEIAKAEGK